MYAWRDTGLYHLPIKNSYIYQEENMFYFHPVKFRLYSYKTLRECVKNLRCLDKYLYIFIYAVRD